MLRTAIATIATKSGGAGHQMGRQYSSRPSSAVSSSVINSTILRSLKDHYVEVSQMSPPPKVSPPVEFTIVKGALDNNGPVLKRQYKNEEIKVSVMRLASFVEEEDVNGDDDEINQLFVLVDISKPAMEDNLQILCGLYPDALGIQSVALRPKSDEGFLIVPNKFTAPPFENLDEKTRDGFHNYIEERGINESLFPFLQAWVYVKDHRNLMQWFRSVGNFIAGHEATKEIDEPKVAAGANGAKGDKTA